MYINSGSKLAKYHSKSHDMSFRYVFVNPRLENKPVTQEQLLYRAWALTGATMRTAIRNYSNGKQKPQAHAARHAAR